MTARSVERIGPASSALEGRGFETVTYVLRGEVEHRDSVGNQGVIGPGDVQWMTAGDGIVHSEMPSERLQTEGGVSHGLQLWVNLPAELRRTQPTYQALLAVDMATATGAGWTAQVVAGSMLGVDGPATTHTPIGYARVSIEPGATVSIPVAEGHTALIYASAATTSTQSINRKLIDYACKLLGNGLLADVTIETIDLNDYEMPIYSADRESAGGVPDLARNFYDKIGQADAVLVSFAEHNGFYTAAYKNVFDWASRIDMRVYQDRPVVLFSTSGGPGGGGNVLNTAVMSGQFFGYDVKASLSIPSFYENFDSAAGELTNPELDEQFRSALATLAGPVSAAA